MNKESGRVGLPLKMLKDVIIQLLSDGRFLIFNTFTRSNIVCENDILILCQELITETDVLALIGKYKDRTFKVWDTEYFSNADGLLADPTRINWASLHEGDNSELNLDQTISLLLKKSILVEDVEQYRSRFRQKASHFDTNFGNFHQQLGYHLIFEQKINPAEWWLGQKFTEDYDSLRNNLYKAVQGSFLERFFHESVKPGMRVIDIGCGTGFYCNMMADLGAEVVGIDPSELYMKVAQETTSENIKYYVSPLREEKCLDFLESDYADVVFISDALLFYFVSPTPEREPDIELLLDEIHRVLKPSGRFWSIEPNYTFWLAPWLGDDDHPFTVLNEYRKRNFLVTPTISEFVSAITAKHFALIAFKELYADPDVEIESKKAQAFASEFPAWQFFEFLRRDQIEL